MKIVNRSLNYQQGKLAIVFLCLLTLSASRGETTSGTAVDSGVPSCTVTDIGLLPGFTQMTGSAINIEGDIAWVEVAERNQRIHVRPSRS